MKVTLCGTIPFTITVDTETGEVSEYLVDENNLTLDSDYAEHRDSGQECYDELLKAKAYQLANQAEWPSMELM